MLEAHLWSPTRNTTSGLSPSVKRSSTSAVAWVVPVEQTQPQQLARNLTQSGPMCSRQSTNVIRNVSSAYTVELWLQLHSLPRCFLGHIDCCCFADSPKQGRHGRAGRSERSSAPRSAVMTILTLFLSPGAGSVLKEYVLL